MNTAPWHTFVVLDDGVYSESFCISPVPFCEVRVRSQEQYERFRLEHDARRLGGIPLSWASAVTLAALNEAHHPGIITMFSVTCCPLSLWELLFTPGDLPYEESCSPPSTHLKHFTVCNFFLIKEAVDLKFHRETEGRSPWVLSQPEVHWDRDQPRLENKTLSLIKGMGPAQQLKAVADKSDNMNLNLKPCRAEENQLPKLSSLTYMMLHASHIHMYTHTHTIHTYTHTHSIHTYT